MERPLDRQATLRRFAGPALVCSAILLACYLRTAEGTRHPSPWGYRLWSFGALAYSDILALHEDRGAKRHPLPYVEDRIEYPVLLGLGMWLPSVLAPGRAGYFALTFVRPGSYALYAFVNGVVGEYQQDGVVVAPGDTSDLGEVVWNVIHPGNSIAWEIGVPDRDSTEFRHGTDYFEPFLFQQFASEFSGPLEYTVGSSDWSTDWNYAQVSSIEPGSPWKWRINFNLDNINEGNATLTLALAGSDHARIVVYVNDESRPLTSFYPDNGGGNALIREGSHAKYSVAYLNVPTFLLDLGANTITLVQGSSGHVMYDYLNLEMP